MQVWQMTEAHYIRTSGGAGDGGAAMITDEDLEGRL